jgi:hypothetical protein
LLIWREVVADTHWGMGVREGVREAALGERERERQAPATSPRTKSELTDRGSKKRTGASPGAGELALGF